MLLVDQPRDHVVERALVAHVELLGVVRTRLLGVAAHARAAPTRDLADAVAQRALPHRLALARGDDHARVGHGNADERDDLLEHLVGNAVVEHVGVDIHGGLHARHADGVRAHAVDGLQMLRVHDEARELVAIALEPEQHAQAHVVDAALHRAVHRLGVPVVVAFRPRRVQALVALLVVRFLEQDICADLGLLEHAVLVHRRGGDVHVHAADGAVFVLDGIDGVHRLQDVLDGVVLRVLARLDGQALVAHVLQRDDLGANLVLRELAARNLAVLGVIGAVQAAVHAVVRQVQRREKHDAVAVIGLLDVVRKLLDGGVHPRILASQKHARLAMGYHGAVLVGRVQVGLALLQDVVAQLQVILVRVGEGERFQDLLVIDELIGAERFRVI